MRIKSVSVRHADRSIWGHLAEREKTLPLVTPLDIYPQFQETRGSWFWDSGMAVVQIETSLEPVSLLSELQSIEQLMGRKRSDRRWGPRLIDIDLLLYEGRKIQLEELQVPHPRMHERAFVLVPLAELDPGLEITGHGSVGNCLQQIDCSGIKRRTDENLD